MASSECSSFGYELLTIAARNGAGWNAAACACQTTLRDAHSLGSHPVCAGFKRLVTLDVLLAGTSVLLEFAALIALRIREPQLDRPFRVPGGMAGAVLLGVCPLLLLGFSVVHSQGERLLGMNALVFGVLLIIAGFLAYWPCALKNTSWAAVPVPFPEAVPEPAQPRAPSE